MKRRTASLVSLTLVQLAAIGAGSIQGEAEAASAGRGRGAGTYYLEPGDVVLVLGGAVTADGGYVDLVVDDIRKRYPELARKDPELGVRFVNAGAAGETAGEGLRRLGALLATHAPTVAVVCFGLSDCRKDRASYPGNMSAIVRRLKGALGDARAVTVLTSPCVHAAGRPELKPYVTVLGEMAEELRLVAARERVVFADCYTPMRRRAEDGGGDFTWGDGLHPNDAGRRLMADALQKAWGFGKPPRRPQATVEKPAAAAREGGGPDVVIEGPGSVVDTWLDPDFPARSNHDMDRAYVQAMTPDRILMRFEIPRDAQAVRRAVLKLYVDEVRSGGYDVTVHKVKTRWEAGTATYSRPWRARGMSAGEDYDADPVASARPGTPPSWVEIDVTRVVRAWCSGEPNRGFLVKAAPGPGHGGRYRVRTTDSDENGPRLVLEGVRLSSVTAGPAPAKPSSAKPSSAKPSPAKPTPPRPVSGWTSIFNGRDLTGWKHAGGRARVEGGAIVAAENADLLYAADWTEFVFSCEVTAGGGTSQRLMGIGLAHPRMGRAESRVRVYFYTDGDVHVSGGGRQLWKAGSGKFRPGDWMQITFEVGRDTFKAYKGGKLMGSADLSGVPVKKGGVYFYANGDHTARMRNARVRVLSR